MTTADHVTQISQWAFVTHLISSDLISTDLISCKPSGSDWVRRETTQFAVVATDQNEMWTESFRGALTMKWGQLRWDEVRWDEMINVNVPL